MTTATERIECPSCKSRDDVTVIDYGHGHRKGVCDRCLYEWRLPFAEAGPMSFHCPSCCCDEHGERETYPTGDVRKWPALCCPIHGMTAREAAWRRVLVRPR